MQLLFAERRWIRWGDRLGHSLALVDGLVVVGGSRSAARPLFETAMMTEISGSDMRPDGPQFRRLASVTYDLEDSGQRELFLTGEVREIPIPGRSDTVNDDPISREGVGRSRLGTSEAAAIGADTFALAPLDEAATRVVVAPDFRARCRK